jgi:polyphosphate kinase 2 (PPK2 family)
MLVQSGIILIKYFFAINPDEQERRFKSRLEDPRKRWKIGPIDVASRAHWTDYSRARDEMFLRTDTDEAPWHVVGADVKRHARLNCIHHLLQTIPWRDLPDEPIELPALQRDANYQRPPKNSVRWVPEVYGSGAAESDV